MAVSLWLTKNRLETLVDGIFAISMTLLVLNLDVPVMKSAQVDVDLQASLLALWPHFFAFGLSFALLAIFWMTHHRQFHVIERIDEPFIWLNVLMLLFIALVPFSTSLVGEYGETWVANFFFEANLLCIGLCMLAYWVYAGRNNRLMRAEFAEENYILGFRRCLVLPAASLVAMGASFWSPANSTLAFLLIPVLVRVLKGRQPEKT